MTKFEEQMMIACGMEEELLRKLCKEKILDLEEQIQMYKDGYKLMCENDD